ncbi:Signal transduction histidine kinase-like protein [Mycolicibacterium aurum]|uniref:Signal transduction histidine kinase-like protein n=1 Tax=Mycolicibacterium aurum TaxID=1791 RepID=A0A3S4RYS1_MYCAU|nr:ATP-binding protein [Mycolicibacterium aurum]VEG52115.1 Signal transduction histidine kinase-like protein [Mycolicibacterium aurum]
MSRAGYVGLLMRNSINLGVASIALADPESPALSPGTWLLAILATWSLYRVLTRSGKAAWLAVDYLLVLAVCLAIPALVPDPDFYVSNTAPQAIAGTAVVSICVSVSAYASIPMTLGIAAAYAYGAAAVTGWENLSAVSALHYFVVQCATASVIRVMLIRVAGAIDQARHDREEAEVAEQVSDAVRDYEREQLALLHDTAASTLLMVGQGPSLPAARLAAQARRDLHLLNAGAWEAPPPRVELVAALRDCAAHLSTPVDFDGRERLWLSGEVAHPVIAAAREAMTNVDRHARASTLRVTVSDTSVRLADDGIGFDVDVPRRGHGIDDSIIGRMKRARGQARIASTPGGGTVTELSWSSSPPPPVSPPSVDPDRLVVRTQTRYGLALTVYALVNLAVTVPAAYPTGPFATIDVMLGIVAALSALAAVPGILWQHWTYAWGAALAMVAVAIAQPALLAEDQLLGYAHWAQGAIGWCVIPLMLALPTRAGVSILVGYWVINSAVIVIRDPSSEILVNIGLGSASILGVQLFALVFNGLMRDAATAVEAENEARQRLLTRDRISQALRTEYQRRYAAIVANVVPLLDALTRGQHVDSTMQMQARAECRRLRTLFDQASTFEHPLMQRMRPLIDRVETRHVDVVTDLTGALPHLDAEQITALVAPLADVLDHAATSARVVISGAGSDVEISVVVDTLSDIDSAPGGLGDAEIVMAGRELWCVIRTGKQSIGVGGAR